MPPQMNLDALNDRFAIPGIAEIVPGNGALPKVQVTHPAVAAEIYLHGAQLTSWQPAGHDEVIFLSEKSRWEDGRAIRGGIPVCFPWFRGKADNPQAPAHGVARTKAWELAGITQDKDSVTVVLTTGSDDASRKWWPFDFHLEHRLTLGAELRLELIVTNTGSAPLRFEEALHTYYRVGDVEKLRIAGLDGVFFLDNTEGNSQKTQAGDIKLSRQTDNAYLNTRHAIEIFDPVLRRRIRIEKENSLTTVVWNPWQEGARALADLGDEEWRQMACVEGSNILSAAVDLASGATHAMAVKMSVTTENA